MCNEGNSEEKNQDIHKQIFYLIKWSIGVIVIIYLTMYLNDLHENKYRSELIVNNIDYDIKWRVVKDENSSELSNVDLYQIYVRTSVTNKKESHYPAKITNAEYYILDSNNKIKSRWISKHDIISIYPGVTFTKTDTYDEIHLTPDNYTLHGRIEYEDNRGILEPLMLSAKLVISYSNSYIVLSESSRQ